MRIQTAIREIPQLSRRKIYTSNISIQSYEVEKSNSHKYSRDRNVREKVKMVTHTFRPHFSAATTTLASEP
jgi:hypothetical protein